jgi:uncharacterized membrane protein YjjP (DUF1212 family)
MIDLMGKEFGEFFFIHFYFEIGKLISAFITGILISVLFKKNQITYGTSLIFIEYLYFFYIVSVFIDKGSSLYITLLLSLFSSIIAIICGIKVISFIRKKIGSPMKKVEIY